MEEILANLAQNTLIYAKNYHNIGFQEIIQISDRKIRNRKN
jgi:hypothetical protein